VLVKHVTAIIEELIADGVLQVVLYDPTDSNADTVVLSQFNQASQARNSILTNSIVSGLINSDKWEHYSEMWHYPYDALLELHISGVIQINFEYSLFKLSTAAKALIIDHVLITMADVIAVRKLDKTYVSDIIHNKVRYSSVQLRREVRFGWLMEDVIKQAKLDGLWPDSGGNGGSGHNGTEAMDYEDVRRLISRVLSEMKNAGQILSIYSSYGSPYHDAVEWRKSKKLDSKLQADILTVAVQTSKLRTRNGLPMMVNYDDYLAELQVRFVFDRGDLSVSDCVVVSTVSSLKGNLKLTASVFESAILVADSSWLEISKDIRDRELLEMLSLDL